MGFRGVRGCHFRSGSDPGVVRLLDLLILLILAAGSTGFSQLPG